MLLLLLRLGAFFCFLGWSWVHFYWEGPYGVLLWQDSTFELAGKLGIEWEEFVGTGANDGLVQRWIARIWWLYLVCTILCLTVRKHTRIQLAALAAGSGLLVILSYAKYVSAQKQLPMFIEHGGQMLMPVLLVLALHYGVRHRATVITAIVAFIMTFAGHGIYALGWPWPTPANFYAMTSVILDLNHDSIRWFLRVAGILDFLICLGILIPILRRSSVLYGAVWGLVTALARPMAGMSTNLNYWGADQFIHETVLRAPHFMIPLYLFFLWYKPQSAIPSTANSGD